MREAKVAYDYYRGMRTPRNLIFLCALFVVAGLFHFWVPEAYLAITPLWVPYRLEMVYLSGLAEIAGGLGLLFPLTRKAAGIGLIALLIAVFPANIQMLSTAIREGAPAAYQALLFFRLPLQPLLILWVYRSAVRRRS